MTDKELKAIQEVTKQMVEDLTEEFAHTLNAYEESALTKIAQHGKESFWRGVFCGFALLGGIALFTRTIARLLS